MEKRGKEHHQGGKDRNRKTYSKRSMNSFMVQSQQCVESGLVEEKGEGKRRRKAKGSKIAQWCRANLFWCYDAFIPMKQF